MNKAYHRINNGKGWENYPSDKTAVDEINLNHMEIGIDEIDNRVVILDETKATKLEVSELFRDVSLDLQSGIITFTRKNGATVVIDTPMEKIQTGIYYDPVTEMLVLPLIDGTSMEVDLSRLMKFDEFIDSDTIAFSVKANGAITAIVKEGSIEEKHLRSDYLSDIQLKVQEAAEAAAFSSENALRAESFGFMAESFAHGATGRRPGEDTDNSKYYSEQAKMYYEDLQQSGNVTGVKGNAESNYRTGNVNITPENVGALSLSGGTLSGKLNPAGGIAYSGKDGYIAFPEGGYFSYLDGNITGFLHIVLPNTWSSTFVKFMVSIFNYATGQSVDYIIAGYTYSSGARWEAMTSICVGSQRNEIANLPVRFGHDGQKCAVSIGNADTTWKYPGVQVHNIFLFYGNTAYARWHSGWEVKINSTPLEKISLMLENPNAAYRCVAEFVTDSYEPNNHNLNISFSLNKQSMDSANWIGAWDSENRELRAIAPSNITGVGSAMKATRDGDGNVIKDTYWDKSKSLIISEEAYVGSGLISANKTATFSRALSEKSGYAAVAAFPGRITSSEVCWNTCKLNIYEGVATMYATVINLSNASIGSDVYVNVLYVRTI